MGGRVTPNKHVTGSSTSKLQPSVVAPASTSHKGQSVRDMCTTSRQRQNATFSEQHAKMPQRINADINSFLLKPLLK